MPSAISRFLQATYTALELCQKAATIPPQMAPPDEPPPKGDKRRPARPSSAKAWYPDHHRDTLLDQFDIPALRELREAAVRESLACGGRQHDIEGRVDALYEATLKMIAASRDSDVDAGPASEGWVKAFDRLQRLEATPPHAAEQKPRARARAGRRKKWSDAIQREVLVAHDRYAAECEALGVRPFLKGPDGFLQRFARSHKNLRAADVAKLLEAAQHSRRRGSL